MNSWKVDGRHGSPQRTVWEAIKVIGHTSGSIRHHVKMADTNQIPKSHVKKGFRDLAARGKLELHPDGDQFTVL